MEIKGKYMNMDDSIFTPNIETSLIDHDLIKKFESYRCRVQSINAEYKEAKEVISRLRIEINTSHEAENSLKLQLSSVQTRLNILEEKRKLYFSICEKQQKNDEKIQKFNDKILDLTNVLNKLSNDCENLAKTAGRELDLIKVNQDMKNELKNKEDSLKLIQNEITCIEKEKGELIQRYEAKIDELKEELKVSNWEKNEIKLECDKKINMYRKQVAEYEETIQEMEKERKSILEDYEISNVQGNKSDSNLIQTVINENGNISSDSIVNSFCVQGENTQIVAQSSNVTRSNITEDEYTIIKRSQERVYNKGAGCSEFKKIVSKTSKSCRKTDKSFPKYGLKQKVQLDFMDSNRDFSKENSQPLKRRLYSQNSNQYFN